MEACKCNHDTPLVVRVYAGGRDGYQVPFCIKVLAEFALFIREQHRKSVVREVKYVQDCRECHWEPRHLVDWLLESDFHVIATHVHQGHKRWNAAHVCLELTRLQNHPGFPSGIQLTCPVFLQHKFQYLKVLPEIVTPTLAIKLPMVELCLEKNAVGYSSSITSGYFNVDAINSFLELHNEGCGWVVKYPFTTVRDGMKFCKKREDVQRALAIASFQYSWRTSYAMIQPCLKNRKEYKVVVLNGCASHVLPQSAGVQVNGSSTFSRAPHRALFRFAEFAVHRLLQMSEGTISNFILRVDIMQRANGNFVVNEFESFEAVYLSSSTKETHKAQSFFEDYWRNVFFGDCLLGKLIND